MKVPNQLRWLAAFCIPFTLAAEEAATPLLTALRSTTLSGNADVAGQSVAISAGHPLQYTRPIFLENLPRQAANASLTSPWVPKPFAAGDFNKDGKLDLALGFTDEARQIGSFIQIHLGRGNGTFLAGTRYNVSASNATSADLNNDGHIDLISSGPDAQINILFGNTNGIFTATSLNGGAGTIEAITIADFNNDGRMDIAANRFPLQFSGNRAVLVWMNSAAGSFTLRTFNSVSGDFRLLSGDFTGDGNADLLTADNTRTRQLFWGDGTGNFTPTMSGSTFSFSSLLGLVARDLNFDNRSDLFLIGNSNSASAFVSARFATQSGTFTSEIRSPLPAVPSGFALADVNSDSVVDLAIGHVSGRAATILRGSSNASFTASTQLSNLQFLAQSILPGDFNGDGKSDLILGGLRLHGLNPRVYTVAAVMNGVGNLASYDLPFQHNDGGIAAWIIDGTNLLSSFRLVNQAGSFNRGYRVIGFNDFNNDQQADVLLQTSFGATAVAFVHASAITNLQTLASMPTIIGLADLNGDGQKEILNVWNNQLYAAFMQGTTRLRQQRILLTATDISTARLIGSGDFNRDGRTDLLWQTASGNFRVDFLSGVTHLRSTFFALQQSGWTAVYVDDLNKNGFADIFVQHTDRRLAAWLMNGTTRVGTVPLNAGRPIPLGWNIAGNR